VILVLCQSFIKLHLDPAIPINIILRLPRSQAFLLFISCIYYSSPGLVVNRYKQHIVLTSALVSAMYTIARHLKTPIKRSLPVRVLACPRTANNSVPFLGRHVQTSATQTDRVRLVMIHNAFVSDAVMSL
jgi:hypothetical protein